MASYTPAELRAQAVFYRTSVAHSDLETAFMLEAGAAALEREQPKPCATCRHKGINAFWCNAGVSVRYGVGPVVAQLTPREHFGCVLHEPQS